MRQIYLEHINLFMLSVIIGGTTRILIGTDEEIKEKITKLKGGVSIVG
ncbi:hypothetical protein [Fusobacterium varium]|nr:hypothetical protein [Fusobacterium varium]